MVGLLTDSGNFSHDDVDEETFLVAAELVKAGADVNGLTYELFRKQPRARAALHSEVTAKTRYYFDGKFAAIVISREALAKCGADIGMTEGPADLVPFAPDEHIPKVRRDPAILLCLQFSIHIDRIMML